jgi:hypothetical protein
MKRYASALEEIRSLLASRSQADPMLDARDVWEELTCYPVPSRRTVRRLIEQVRAEGEFGHRGQSKASGRRGQTKGGYVRSTYHRMTNREIAEKIAELDRRATAHERCSVEIGEQYVTLLGAAAKQRNTPRDLLAGSIIARWLRDNTNLLRPDSPTH